MKNCTKRWRVLSLVVALFAALSLTFAPVYADDDDSDNDFPSQAAIDLATDANLRLSRGVLAGLVDIFLAATEANIPNEDGQNAIRTIFDNWNPNIRLVSNGLPNPQLGGPNNLPRDDFEEVQLAITLELEAGNFFGPPILVDEGDGQFSIRSVFPLQSTSGLNCALCHGTFEEGELTGMVVFRTPLGGGDDDDDDSDSDSD